jgi:quinolinate synthase
MSEFFQKKDLVKKISDLKRKKNAVILVHNYQRPELYEVADFIGDSLGLCIEASKTDAEIIVFCGVNFMAESAVILNPDKKVLVPYLDAGCAMADMVDVDELLNFKKKYPEACVVTYVNSTAEVKSVSDVCCTSANAVDVVRAVPEKKIIFVPDKNLANYVAKMVPEKEIIPWEGYCPVHHFVNKTFLGEIRREYPKAKVIAHPESIDEVLAEADYVASTSQMISYAKNDVSKDFFVLTECGMVERLNKELPQKKFYGLCNRCFDMKKNTLESVLKSLELEKERVIVDSEVAKKAKRAFDRMFELT